MMVEQNEPIEPWPRGLAENPVLRKIGKTQLSREPGISYNYKQPQYVSLKIMIWELTCAILLDHQYLVQLLLTCKDDNRAYAVP